MNRPFRSGPDSRWSLLGLVLLMASPSMPADDDDTVRPATAAHERPYTSGVVQLSDAQQKAAGLVTLTLAAVRQSQETLAYGKVLDILPLLTLQAQFRAAKADAEVTAATLKLTSKNRERITALHQADIIASRDLATIDAQWQSDRTRDDAARRRMEEIRREALHNWGPELSGLALGGPSALFEALASHHRFLTQITLPPSAKGPTQETMVFVARDFDRSLADRAVMISIAPRTDDLVQGETWFFHVKAGTLRAGMRVNAWLTARTQRDGVLIPPEAVVWHAGKPWVYRRDAGGKHVRTPLTGASSGTQGWFMESGLIPGDEIVITGAQTLLSEEFREQIPDGDDD